MRQMNSQLVPKALNLTSPTPTERAVPDFILFIQGSKFALRIRINAKKSEAKRIRFASLRIKSLAVRFAFASHFLRKIRINSPKFALLKKFLVKVFLNVFGLKMVVVVIRSAIWPCVCPFTVVFFVF